jgi:hypothetical protein
MKKTYRAVLFLLLLSGIFSCRKILDRPSWDTNITAPLIKTSLGIGNIIKDTAAFKKNSDNSISIVENKLLYSFGIDSLVKLAVEPYDTTVRLSSLKLDDQVVTRNISLGEIARQLMASSNSNNQLIGFGIIASNGQVTTVPPFGGITAGPFDIDISQYFETADLLTGTMTVTITNGLPLDIQTLQYQINNAGSGTIIDNYTFTNLASHSSQVHATDLAGKTVEGALKARILNMDVDGGTVLIDTSDALQVKIAITNITVSSATAVFPTQDVIDDHNDVPLVNMGDIQLTKAKLQKGIISMHAINTLDEPLFFTYSIPGASKNGVPFVANATIEANSDIVIPFDFAGYDLDLTGELQNSFNSIYNTIKGSIHYSGVTQTLSLQDSINVVLSFDGIEPYYIEGYLGRDTIDIGPSSVSFDLFNKIESGTLSFENVKLSVVVNNGVGVDGNVSINQITAHNKSGTTLGLNILPITNHYIARATDNPLTPVIDTINLSPPGSNAVALLNFLPNKITYQAQGILNPSGFSGYNDFAYINSGFEPYLQLELPLSLIANQLVLSDTVEFNGQSQESAIKDGNFTIHIQNGFPLSGDLKLYFLDAAGSTLDTLVSSGSILAAPVSGGIVTSKAYSKVPFHVSEATLSHILHSKKVVFKVKFSTQPPATFTKIYSDYEIDFKLVGQFDYHVH